MVRKLDLRFGEDRFGGQVRQASRILGAVEQSLESGRSWA
jgi:hypothetical protein